jgi:hypothetical protein
MLGTGPGIATLRYNIIFVLTFALATAGGYALVRQLGATRLAAMIAAVGFAYAPFRLGQASHLQLLSAGGIALALAMLARGHGWSLRSGYRRERTRAGWAVAGWLAVAWQLSLGLAVGLPLGYVLLLILVGSILGWLLRRRPRLPRHLLIIDGVGAVLAAAVIVALYLPYRTAMHANPGAHASDRALAPFSPSLRGLFTSPVESWLWGSWHDTARAALPAGAGNTALPGFFLIALALAGLVVSVWTMWQRLLLAVGVAVSVVLAMGTSGPGHGHFGYLPVFHYLPGFSAVRAPSWLLLWTTLLLAVLAAGAVCRFAERAAAVGAAVHGRVAKPLVRWSLRLALVIPLALVVVEGVPAYHATRVPAAPKALTGVTDPVVILPSRTVASRGAVDDALVALWSTGTFPDLANGPGDVVPGRLATLRGLARDFPDQESVDLLRDLGVRTIIVLRAPAAQAGYAVARPGGVDEDAMGYLGLTLKETPEALIFTLDGNG